MKKIKLIYTILMTIVISLLMIICVKAMQVQNYVDAEINKTAENNNAITTLTINTLYDTMGVNNTIRTSVMTEINNNDIVNVALNEDDIVENVETDTVIEEVIIETPEPEYYNGYSEYEVYELAKIIMCEAEGESQKCKEYIGQVILNRVKSNKFPNTIHGVIFDGYQFTPTFDGRWNRVEPNEACFDAAYKVLSESEYITDALYFEACNGQTWHSRKLNMICQIDNTRFYVEY